jgi:hypothetical protein
MDHKDVVRYLAQNSAKTFFPLTDEDVVKDLTIPYFKISKDRSGGGYCGYNISMHAYEKHDNAPRMPYYCEYILKNVLPNISTECDVSGYYPIELHDAITYLNNDKDYDNALVFAKKKNDALPVLIPDPFMIGNYGGKLNIVDEYKWETKKDKCAFYGVTTGSRNPMTNQRLKLCKWAVENRDICDFYITGVVQMDVSDVIKVYGDPLLKKMVHLPVTQQEQYKNRFLLSIDGNTCSYDRLCWIMKSNSLCLKYPSDDMLWYYPLLSEGQHFVSCHEPNFKNVMTYHSNNMKETEFIIENAHKFVDKFASPVSAIMYTTYLFETFADNK